MFVLDKVLLCFSFADFGFSIPTKITLFVIMTFTHPRVTFKAVLIIQAIGQQFMMPTSYQ